MSAAGRVLVVGDVMTDVIVRPEGPLVRGSDRRATIQSRPGGSAANQAVWLGAMGAKVSFVARVAAGDKPRLEAYFKGFHVDPILAADPQRPSGVLVVLVDADGERSFLTDRGANLALEPSDIPVRLLDETRLVLVSGYSLFAEGPRRAVSWLAEEARRRGIPITIDAASVSFLRELGVGSFLEWTRGMSTLLANADEAEALSGTGDLTEQMIALGAYFERVIIKRGARGAAVGGRHGLRLDAPAPPVEVVDTTGAGDAFAAGFIAAELEGTDEAECLLRAIEAGSKAVKQLGAQPG
ncbi:sugar kinase [Sorangium sp. So ce375]|uniref:carbohydrate kinase family protein n=1 Tax=Sorangium sp. So ce375 TaxID=3133306 RepID=UPI003F5BCB86